jgi:hypothetical protein
MTAPATVDPRRDFASERPGVALRLDATPQVQVVIGARAMRAISEETRAFSRDHGLETGGWLFGEGVHSWNNAVEVSFATGPGARSRHGQDWCELDYDLLLQRQHELDQARTAVAYVGEWHVHPDGLVHRPSEGDLRAWRRRWQLVDQEPRLGRKRRFMPRYVGLLVGPGEGRMAWSAPRLRLSAWIVQNDERGRIVCEPSGRDGLKVDPARSWPGARTPPNVDAAGHEATRSVRAIGHPQGTQRLATHDLSVGGCPAFFGSSDRGARAA